MVEKIKQRLSEKSNPDKIKILSSFFKTGKGEYGEGDIFIGIAVPENRKVAKEFVLADFDCIEDLINSPIHEERLCALIIMVEKFKKADEEMKSRIFNFYLSHTEKINNWDLVDLSAPYIVGAYLIGKDKEILYKLSESENIWERRISIVSTLFFIRKGETNDALRLAEILVNDRHDLIQKATGWVLREVGKKNEKLLTAFLEKYCRTMPRTMLRYSIEKLDLDKKNYYMGRR